VAADSPKRGGNDVADMGRPSGGDSSVAGAVGDVAGTAKEQATQVGGQVKEQAGNVAQEVAHQTQTLVDQTVGTLREQAHGRTSEAAQALRQWSDQARALSEGRAEDAGEARRYVLQASDKLAEVAQHVERRGFDGLLEDVQRIGREKPGLFLLGAGAAGFLAGRLLRGASASSGSAGDGASGSSNGSQAQAPVPVMGPAAWGETDEAVPRGFADHPDVLPPQSYGGV
jgi:uncharacterized protein YjbJ (UPF0337 family)